MNPNINRRTFIKKTVALTASLTSLSLISSCTSDEITSDTASKTKTSDAKTNEAKTSYGEKAATTTATREAATPKEHTIEIKGFQFAPKSLSVNSGDTITWVNRDSAPHTATAKDGSWDTGTIAPNEQKSLKVEAGMSADYQCNFHPNMVGEISVVK